MSIPPSAPLKFQKDCCPAGESLHAQTLLQDGSHHTPVEGLAEDFKQLWTQIQADKLLHLPSHQVNKIKLHVMWLALL
jgi:hypothetical protein